MTRVDDTDTERLPHGVIECIRYVGGEEMPAAPERQDRLATGLTICICSYKRPKSLCQFLSSVAEHDTKPNRLVIVDASPDTRTKEAFLAFDRLDETSDEIVYYRVGGDLETLTCSRNFALKCANTDLVVFFDDDIVLKEGCLAEMVRVHRTHGEEVVGVGALDLHGVKTPSWMWRIRRLLGIVPTLRAGAYTRSGISIPWTFQGATEKTLQGDWLSGCCMMWKTEIARQVGFNEGFGGHSTGEDLDVSLRMGRHGKLLVSGRAHILHLHEPAGRPNLYKMGYAGIRNSYEIHRNCLPNRTFLDGVRFMYAYGMDTFLRIITMVRPGNVARRWSFVRGRLAFFTEQVFRRRLF